MKHDKQRMQKAENSMAKACVEQRGAPLDVRLGATTRGAVLAFILIGVICVPAQAQIGPTGEVAAKLKARADAAAAAAGARSRQTPARPSRGKPRRQTPKSIAGAGKEQERGATKSPKSPKSASIVRKPARLPIGLETDDFQSAGLGAESTADGALDSTEPQVEVDEQDDAPLPFVSDESLTKTGAVPLYNFDQVSNSALLSGRSDDFARLSGLNSLWEIKDKHRAYILTFKNEDGRRRIVEGLRKYPRIEVVSTREEADFIISYTDEHGFGKVTTSSSSSVPLVEFNLTGRMTITMRGEQNADGSYAEQILWVDTNTRERLYGIPFGPFEPRHPATNLTRHFIDALKKVRGEKKSKG